MSLPANDCCQFFDHNDYRGDSTQFCLEGKSKEQWNEDEVDGWMRRWDSLKCGKEVRVEWGNDSDSSFAAGPAFLRNLVDTDINFIRMHHYDADALIGGVNVYTGDQCGTHSKFLPGGQYGDQVGYGYHMDISTKKLLSSRDVRALSVPVGYKVTIFKEDWYGGDSYDFYGQNDLYGAMWCHKLPNGWTGFRSIKILSLKGTEGANSSWVKIGSGYDPIMVTGAINGDD